MRIHFRPILLLTAVLVLALLAGCQGQAEPTLDTTALAENIAVNIFGTLTAQPTNTLEPSATPSATPTITKSLTPVPTLNVTALAGTIQANVAEALVAQLPSAAPTLDVPVLVSTVQVAVVETLLAPQIATATAQAQRQLDQQATQTAVASQPIEVLPDDDPALGPENAPVLIIEFSDFTCPHCADFALNTLPRLLETYGDYVRFVFRDAPILGPNSGWAALGAECADDQGKFWAFHDSLFSSQSSISPTNLPAFAEQADLDVDAFNTCVQEQTHLAELQNDLNAAAAAGLAGTPLFYINGQRVEGAQPFEAFAQIIEAELAKAGVEMTPEATAAATVEATVETTAEATPETTPGA